MKIDKERVQALRKEQSWSQEELATAAGLNLRTIQRIEAGGSASLQSRKALAAAFNVEVGDLDAEKEGTMPIRYEYKVVPFEMKWRKLGIKLLTDFASIESQMNAMSADGWELVKLIDVLGSGGVNMVATAALVATFRRAVA